jgi:hypothetical protein
VALGGLSAFIILPSAFAAFRPVRRNFCYLFRAIDEGNAGLNI